MTEPAGSFEETRLEPAVVADLHARHAEELRLYLLGLLRNDDLAAEVVQAAFVKVAEHGHSAREGSLKAWLFRVAHNEAMDRRRRSAIETRVVRNSAWWKPQGGPAADQFVDRSETVERVRRAIDELPAEQREVVRLRIYAEKTFAEIAFDTGAPLGTVLTRMRLASKKLADVLRSEIEP